MPERDRFPKHYFDGNPYEGKSPDEVYKKLRWGNEPDESFDIEAPESMVTLGDVAKLVTADGEADFSEDEAPFLAVGVETNRIYIVPKDGDGPVHIPAFGDDWVEIGEIGQIDYYSDKGGEEAYYYHEHEPPYPTVYMHEASGVCVLMPAELEDGSRSYAVGDEGVIG